MPTTADDGIELGVIVALRAEAAVLERARIDSRAVIVAGIGNERAFTAATRLLERGARALLSFGVCGGLAPPLRSGDLLLPRRVVSDYTDSRTNDGMRARLLRAMPDAREIETLYCSRTPVFSPQQKSALAARGFDAVDMESAGVAQAATRTGVPFAVIKAVCDPASRAVPSIALRMLNTNGRLRWNALFETVFSGPRTWHELRALRGDFAAACASLQRAAQNLPVFAETDAP